MAYPRTLAKTTNKAKALLAAATRCACYCLSNGFSGEDCSASCAGRELYQFSFAKLIIDGPTKARVRVHSNCWYELTLPEGAL